MKKVLKKITTYLFVLICFIFIGYLFLKTPTTEEANTEKYNIKLENESVIFPVSVMKMEKRTFVRLIKSNGIVKSNQEAEVFPQISGRIVKSNIKEGAHVKKGDVLLELDDRELKISLANADNDVTRAQFEYLVLKIGEDSNRIIKSNDKIKFMGENFLIAKNKYAKGEMDQDEYLNLRNQYELAIMATGEKRDISLQSRSGLLMAINNLKKAELNLSYTKPIAPFSGFIADYDLSVGAYITPGKPICKIVDISTIKVVVGILESDVKMLYIGRSVDITIPALGEEKYKGKVTAISPIIDPEKKTCKIEVEFPNPDQKVKPGMYANCIIEGEVLPNKLLIPKKSLLVRTDRKLVFTVKDDKAQWCYVTTGVENEDWVEITEGLNIDDILIIDGHYTLSHNASVRIEKEQK